MANLNNDPVYFSEGKDSIVIVQVVQTVPGGRTLDVTGFTPDEIRAGHIVIEETATGKLKPMPVSEGNYGSLPSNHTYYGVVISTVPKSKPFVGIMKGGTINHKAAPYGMNSILAAFKTALPTILSIPN